jgi:septal ring factor EnvC (AmiA/AmiB activator)
MRKPTTNPVTQTAAQHGYEATDYSFQPDEWVYAPQAGTITDVTLNAGDCGKRIILKSGTTEYYMCHFQDVAVKVGQVVPEGFKLGIMGETGKAFGRHLHLVIMVNGVRVPDPDKWLNSKLTGGSMALTATQVKAEYRTNRGPNGKAPTAAEITLHSTKGTYESLSQGFRPENDARFKAHAAEVAKLNATIAAKSVEVTKLQASITVKDAEIAKLKAELTKPPVAGGFTEADRTTLNAIMSVVTTIKDKILAIFK